MREIKECGEGGAGEGEDDPPSEIDDEETGDENRGSWRWEPH